MFANVATTAPTKTTSRYLTSRYLEAFPKTSQDVLEVRGVGILILPFRELSLLWTWRLFGPSPPPPPPPEPPQTPFLNELVGQKLQPSRRLRL